MLSFHGLWTKNSLFGHHALRSVSWQFPDDVRHLWPHPWGRRAWPRRQLSSQACKSDGNRFNALGILDRRKVSPFYKTQIYSPHIIIDHIYLFVKRADNYSYLNSRAEDLCFKLLVPPRLFPPSAHKAFVRYCLLPQDSAVKGRRLLHSKSSFRLLSLSFSRTMAGGALCARPLGSALSPPKHPAGNCKTTGNCFLTSFPLSSLYAQPCGGIPASLPFRQEMAVVIC